MAFDAKNILRGLNDAATPVLVAMDESDIQAIAVTPNADGNSAVDIRKTGVKGLAAVAIYLGPSASEQALLVDNDYAKLIIQASDQLEGSWEDVATFPTVYYHVLEVYCTATVAAFTALSIGSTVTQETTADTGILIAFDQELLDVDGVGKLYIAVTDEADVFNEAAGKTLIATSPGPGSGIKTYGVDTTVASPVMAPGIYVVRFATNKRYVRCNYDDVLDSFGKVWVLLTDNAFGTI